MNIVITGSNRGLGFELALAAAQRGHNVKAGIRSKEPEGKLLELIGQFPSQIEAVQLDVCSEKTIASLAEKLQREQQPVDCIINNAGILLSRSVSIEQIPLEDVVRSFEINLFGPMMVIKHLLPLMPDGGLRAVLNISSDAGSLTSAYGGDYPYGTSKTAFNKFSKQLQHYVRGRGIRVYAIHPGWIKTNMGGERAPGDPAECANSIIDILEKKIDVGPEAFFINYKGEPMSI